MRAANENQNKTKNKCDSRKSITRKQTNKLKGELVAVTGGTATSIQSAKQLWAIGDCRLWSRQRGAGSEKWQHVMAYYLR